MNGIITKQISNQYTVNIKGKEYVCSARGKFRNLNLSPLVGDKVKVDVEKLLIEEILPRTNTLDRPSVSNVDIALIVTSVKNQIYLLVFLIKK